MDLRLGRQQTGHAADGTSASLSARLGESRSRLRKGQRHNSTPIHPNTLLRAYEKLIERVGVPRIRVHDLRHTSATLLLASREHPKVVRERLELFSISETLDGYSYVSPDAQQRAAAHFDPLFERSVKTIRRVPNKSSAEFKSRHSDMLCRPTCCATLVGCRPAKIALRSLVDLGLSCLQTVDQRHKYRIESRREERCKTTAISIRSVRRRPY